jgi:hypothetical protein
VANRRNILWIGLAGYVVSFFLVGVVGTWIVGSIRGYNCAYNALLNPWTEARTLRQPTAANLADYLSIAISGLINPLFLVWVFKPSKPLRTALIVMMPFCWVAFHLESLYPREGYFLWTISMLLVLFSGRSAGEPVTATS